MGGTGVCGLVPARLNLKVVYSKTTFEARETEPRNHILIQLLLIIDTRYQVVYSDSPPKISKKKKRLEVWR